MEKKLSLIKQIPAGYKKSELGVIPEDWDVNVVEDIADVKSGKRLPLGKYLIDSETTHPYIRVTDMFQGGVSLSEIKYVPEDVFPTIQNYKIFKDDIFISVAGTLGIVGKIPVKLDGANLTENADRLTNITCDRDYLLYVFTSPLIQGIIESERTLGAQPKLALTRIRKFKVVLPNDKTEQTAIATVLSATDALIEHLERLIAKKKAIKQGAMQQLLTGKKRLPGFSGKWDLKTLGEIGETYGGLSGKKKSDFYGGKYPYIPFMNIMSNPVIDLQYFDYVNIRGDEKQNKSIKGDLFFNGSSETPEEVGMCSVLQGDIPNLYLNSFCFGFRLNRDLKTDGLYLSYFFRSPMGRQLIFSLAQGATRYNLSKINFMKLKIPYPDPIEQTAIANILSDMDAEIESLEQKRDKYTMLKQGMMQQLLTGRIRIYANN